MMNIFKKTVMGILILVIGILTIVSSLPIDSHACDVAVVSSKASVTGRPVLWKNRDHPNGWMQEVYFCSGTNENTGGSVRVIDRATINSYAMPSGGTNEAGFAITNTAIYAQQTEIIYYSANDELIALALEKCTTVEEFEHLLTNWHDDPSNRFKLIDANIGIIDAHGGASLYEVADFIGTKGRLLFNRFDANNGYVTDQDKKLIGINGSIGSIPEGYIFEDGNLIDSEGNPVSNEFIGFINRTNSNYFSEIESDDEREFRAYELLSQMAEVNELSHIEIMQKVAKDVCGQIEKHQELNSFNTFKRCISKADTNLSLVVDGVAPGDDPRFTTFWCNIGEPSVGVNTPYFPAAKEVTYYGWAEYRTNKGTPKMDITASCLLNMAIDCQERTMYNNNKPYEKPDYAAKQDYTIDYSKLLEVQRWTFPLEDYIIQKTELFLDELRQDNSMLSADELADFSHIAAEFAYENYIHQSSEYYEWDSGINDPCFLATVASVDE